MTREEAISKAINIVRYFEAHFAKSKEAREDATNIIEALEQEPCGDCISREETLKALMDEWTEYDRELIDYLFEKIDKLPSVTPQPKVGRWERDQFTNQPTCSVCGYKVFGGQTRYCPNCGSNNGGEG